MDWHFHFDYLALQAPMSLAGVERLAIRPYAALVEQSSVSDALHVLAAASQFADVNPRLNHRGALIPTLARFCARATDYDPVDAEGRRNTLLGAELTRREARLPAGRRQFRNRFSAGNRTLAQAFGSAAATLDWPDTAPAGSLDMEALFSRRTVEIAGAWLQGGLNANQARATLFLPGRCLELSASIAEHPQNLALSMWRDSRSRCIAYRQSAYPRLWGR